MINELMGKPANASTTLSKTSDWSVITGSVEWLELVNKGSTEVRDPSPLEALAGWLAVTSAASTT